MVAALYVIKNGPYYGISDVDPWDEDRDARLYAGPHPVVAHPPCARWGRYWFGGPSCKVRKKKGDDGGCFESALASVRTCGGVLEHPAASSAWKHFRIAHPYRIGGWIPADGYGGWTCCVDQGHYGHRAQKATWLYAVGIEDLPELIWGKSNNNVRLDDGFRSTEERRRATRTGRCQRLSARQRKETPDEFKEILLNMARSAIAPSMAQVNGPKKG